MGREGEGKNSRLQHDEARLVALCLAVEVVS
jgi:hypothetical protein